MAIQLPTLPQHAQQNLKLSTNAVNNVPQFGGPTQRVSRMGDRFSYEVTTRSLMYPDAMATVAKLVQGTSAKVLCPVQQPGLTIGTPGSPNVASGSGTTLNLQGFAANYAIRAGQVFSIVHAGKRYLHMAASAATATAGGLATLSIFPMLRTPLTAGDVCEFATPQIEGFLADTSQGWSTSLAQTIGLTFVVVESL